MKTHEAPSESVLTISFTPFDADDERDLALATLPTELVASASNGGVVLHGADDDIDNAVVDMEASGLFADMQVVERHAETVAEFIRRAA